MAYKVKIKNIEKVTHDVKKFVVDKPKGYQFAPGQATEVAIDRPQWLEKKRPFTFTSGNHEPNLEFIIKSYPVSLYPNHKGVTEKIHTLSVGDGLVIEEPWGTIQYKGKGVFLAGGAGITPFIAIFRQLHRENEITGNKLFFSNKKQEDIILERELKNLFGNDDLVLSLTREENQAYESGRINREMLSRYLKNYTQNFYVCGPPQMVDQLSQTLEKLGAKGDAIVFEE